MFANVKIFRFVVVCELTTLTSVSLY